MGLQSTMEATSPGTSSSPRGRETRKGSWGGGGKREAEVDKVLLLTTIFMVGGCPQDERETCQRGKGSKSQMSVPVTGAQWRREACFFLVVDKAGSSKVSYPGAGHMGTVGFWN